MLTGASMSGLIEPGSRTIHSLLLLTRAIFSRHPWIEDLTFFAAMNELAKDSIVSFQFAHQKEVALRTPEREAHDE
jgi:hypothetical protein